MQSDCLTACLLALADAYPHSVYRTTALWKSLTAGNPSWFYLQRSSAIVDLTCQQSDVKYTFIALVRNVPS